MNTNKQVKELQQNLDDAKAMVVYYGEQLQAVLAENTLLKQEAKRKRVH